MRKKGTRNKNYSPEFKISVILDMRNNHLSYSETVRKYWGTQTKAETANYRFTLRNWERIYLEEGEIGFMEEKRGRKSTGRPRKKPLDKNVEEDLIAENQRLRMENECLKKLNALVQERIEREQKKK
ncbi:MAG: helix-turn-helix domain-containing protein [Clostridia bacterium]|nr:helix-turn-helix domain-containing protein [Clostridia bacterium]